MSVLPYPQHTACKRQACEASIDRLQKIENHLAKQDRTGNRAPGPAPMITGQQEARVAPYIANLGTATRIFDDEVRDLAQPLYLFQALRPAGLLEHRSQIGADRPGILDEALRIHVLFATVAISLDASYTALPHAAVGNFCNRG